MLDQGFNLQSFAPAERQRSEEGCMVVWMYLVPPNDTLKDKTWGRKGPHVIVVRRPWLRERSQDTSFLQGPDHLLPL